MASDTPTEGKCNAPAWLNEEEREAEGTSKSGYCEQYPVNGSDTCRMHFGTVDNANKGAPEDNMNNLQHGAHASPLRLYDHLEDEAVEWIDSLVVGYLQFAPFGYEDPRRERLTRYCTMIYQEWKAAGEVMNDGPTKEQPIGFDKNGNPVVKSTEHHLGKRARSLNTKVRQGLKELGCLPSPNDIQGGSETVAQIFKTAVEEASEEGSNETDTDTDNDTDNGDDTIPVDGGMVEP